MFTALKLHTGFVCLHPATVVCDVLRGCPVSGGNIAVFYPHAISACIRNFGHDTVSRCVRPLGVDPFAGLVGSDMRWMRFYAFWANLPQTSLAIMKYNPTMFLSEFGKIFFFKFLLLFYAYILQEQDVFDDRAPFLLDIGVLHRLVVQLPLIHVP